LGQLHGVEVPVHTGAEMLAKKHDLNVIFTESKSLKDIMKQPWSL
jgi:hypothetical protein